MLIETNWLRPIGMTCSSTTTQYEVISFVESPMATMYGNLLLDDHLAFWGADLRKYESHTT